MRSGAETARISSAFFNVVLIAIIKASLDFIKSLSSQITAVRIDKMNETQPQVLEHIYRLCIQFCFQQKVLLQI